MSVQGIQPKLSATLNVSRQRFEVVDIGGHYILKPQNPQFPQLPENEDLSMRLAGAAGIDVPLHGLVYSKDGSFTYFISNSSATKTPSHKGKTYFSKPYIKGRIHSLKNLQILLFTVHKK